MEIPGCGNFVDQGSVLQSEVRVFKNFCEKQIHGVEGSPERLVVVELAVDVVRLFVLLLETLPDLGLLQNRPRLPARSLSQSAAESSDRCRRLTDAYSPGAGACGGGAAATELEALQRTLSGRN